MSTIILSEQINLSSNSAFVKNGSYNSAMIFNLPIMKREQNILYNEISVIHAQIPISYYLINDTNNLFVLSSGSYSLTYGNYNATSFKSHLLNLLGSTFSLVLDSSTGKYTLSCTSSFTILSTTTCYKILGLEKNKSYIVESSLTCPYPCNFLGIQKIKIKSGTFKTNNKDSGNNGHCDILTTIPVNDSQFGLINYINHTNFKNIINNDDIINIDISITDEDDNLINFNGIEINLCLQINSIIKYDFLDNNLFNTKNNIV